MQVQAVGLQVVKVLLQKGIGSESDPFLIFYFGELVEYLFVILHNILKVRVPIIIIIIIIWFHILNGLSCDFLVTEPY